MDSRIWTVFQYFEWFLSIFDLAARLHATRHPIPASTSLDIFTSQQQCKYNLANENRSPDLQKLRARGECFILFPSLHKCVKHLVVVLMKIKMPWCASLCRTANVVCPPAIWYIVVYFLNLSHLLHDTEAEYFFFCLDSPKIRSWLNKLQANPLLSEMHTQSWTKQGELRSNSWTWSTCCGVM